MKTVMQSEVLRRKFCRSWSCGSETGDEACRIMLGNRYFVGSFGRKSADSVVQVNWKSKASRATFWKGGEQSHSSEELTFMWGGRIKVRRTHSNDEGHIFSHKPTRLSIFQRFWQCNCTSRPSLSLIAWRRSETNDSSVPIPRVNVPHSNRS